MTIDGNKDSDLQLVSEPQFEDLAGQAATAPRLRAHLLLHAGPDDQVQRLIIAAQPGTYVRPHQHGTQWEMLIVQSGSMDILTLDEAGEVQSRATLNGNAPIVQIAPGIWHTVVVREPNTIVLEIKPGPYCANQFAQWAPAEGSKEAVQFVAWGTSAGTGQRWPT